MRAAATWQGEWWRGGGGGTVWNAITVDPELNLVYIGVGNGGPWNRQWRSEGKGDNLYLCSIVALRADTGIQYDDRAQGTVQLFRTQKQQGFSANTLCQHFYWMYKRAGLDGGRDRGGSPVPQFPGCLGA